MDNYFGTAASSENSLPALPPKDRQAIAACCSSHVLPFSLVEDPYFQWAYSFSVKKREIIGARVTELAAEWHQKIREKIKSKIVTLALDGWTDSISGKHHICILLWTGEDLFYWENKVMAIKTADSIFGYVKSVCYDIVESGARVVAAVADNARNKQAALCMLNCDINSILPVPCCAHIFALIVWDTFKKTNVGILSMTLLDTFVQSGLIERYSATRWTSRYEVMQKAVAKGLGTPEERAAMQQVIQVLSEVANGIDAIQQDVETVETVVSAFAKVKQSWMSNPALGAETRSILMDVYDKRSKMFLNSALGQVMHE